MPTPPAVDKANAERNSVKGSFTVATNCPSTEKAHHAARETSHESPLSGLQSCLQGI